MSGFNWQRVRVRVRLGIELTLMASLLYSPKSRFSYASLQPKIGASCLGETSSLKFAFTSFSMGLLSARGFFKAGLGYLFAHFTWTLVRAGFGTVTDIFGPIPVSIRIFLYVKFL